MNKGLKVFSILCECSFLGSIILYIYNYYLSTKKYEIIPASIRTSLDLFIIVAIISLILFLIIKYVLYLRNKTKYEDIQLEMNFDEDKANKIEEKYKDLESPVTERVYLYKEDYEVPRERQMTCPNCKRIIDKNATICIKCGYLLKPVIQERIEEKVIQKDDDFLEDLYEVKPKKYNNKLKNYLINGTLVLAIIICIVLIINMAIERGILG